MRTPQERRTEIQQMPTEELRRKYHQGHFGELRPFVEAELIERDLAEKSASDSRAEIREETIISIKRKQLRWAIYASITAVIALVIANKDQIFKLISKLLN